MNAVRILHSADIHYHPDRQTEALASLQTLYEYAASTRPDLIVMAGDLFDKGVQASDGGGYPALIEAIQRLMDLAPIVAVYGTVTHDVPGCYAGLVELNAEHSFTVLDPAHAYYLMDGEVGDYKEDEIGRLDNAQLLIFGCPEPQKSHFLANKSGLGRAEATEAINAGMRQILAGVGARRQEMPSVPALMLYHGTVTGATMCNGQTVPGTDIAVGRDDLALTGADYVALGHIHAAQEVADCMCYAGSAYPVNWGEQDQKSFWDVTITPDQGAEYHRVNYPHPPRKKIAVEVAFSTVPYPHSEFDTNLEDCDIAGKQVWLRIEGVREDIDRIDIDDSLQALIEDYCALPGSRVTTEVIPTETVRAGEIQEKHTLREKVQVYAENSGDEVVESVLEKADWIEEQARADGTVVPGARVRPQKVRARGLKPFLKRGIEEVELDFDAYDPGLICMVGPNGSGKTTLVENSHPYLRSFFTQGNPDRDSMAALFGLKDSWREFYFIDEATGVEYHSTIQIDPNLKSPKVDAQLFRKEGGQWVPMTDGRQNTYKAEIEKLYGPIDLYLRSAFISQKSPKGLPDLADATRGEKRELFRALAGLDYLEGYANLAKAAAKASADCATVYEGKAEVLEQRVAELPGVEADVQGKEVVLEKQQAVMEQVGQVGQNLRVEVDALQERVKEQGARRQELTGAEQRGNELCIEIETSLQAIREAEEAAENGPKAAEIVQRHFDLCKAREGLIDERGEYLKGEAEKDQQHRELMETFQSESNALQADALELARRLGSLGSDKAGLVARVDALSAKTAAAIDETCPTCHQTLPEAERVRLQEERATERSDLAGLQEQVLECDNRITEIEKQQETAQEKIESLEKPEREECPPWANEDALRRLEAELDGTDVATARETLSQAEQASVRIEEGEKREHALRNQLIEVEGRMYLLKKDIDDELDGQHRAKGRLLEDNRVLYAEARDIAVELQTEIRELGKSLEALQADERELADYRKHIQDTQREVAEWSYLQRACGQDGIQALELDAMGPSVTEIANRLLDAAYGARFRVGIRTTKMAGKGSATHQVEDFEIVVYDTESAIEPEQTLDSMSGGETVWIRKALYDAFGIIRARSTGTQFMTAFLDEADGALDPEARGRYFDMIAAAHRESGRHHTIVITHSEEAQQAIPQRIEMAELRAPEKTREVA